MHYIKEPYSQFLYSSRAFDFYFKDLAFGVLDIETTGLNPNNSAFILGGLISYAENSIEQFFVENLSEEKAVLELFIDRLKHLDVIVTYNGEHFDIPFLLKRAKILGLQIDFKMPYNLDLYLVLNHHSSLRKFLPNLKQKTVENFMGLWSERLDHISGKESVELYFRYLSEHDIKIREIILLHNRDDVTQLSKLLPVIEKADFHKAMHCLGFVIKPYTALNDAEDRLHVNKIKVNNTHLVIEGFQGDYPKDYSSFGNNETGFRIEFNKRTSSFTISIPLQSFDGNVFLDLRKHLVSFKELEKYGFFEKDFLILKIDSTINYVETNHFIKLFLTRLGEL